MTATTILVDTSIEVDRVKSGHRESAATRILGEYDHTVSTSIALLEFKATVIQVCVTIHDELARHKRFTFVRDTLVEKRFRQSQLRSAIFNNLIALAQSSHDVTEADDLLLATQARLKLETAIPRLFDDFHRLRVVLDRDIDCTRAKERPKKGRVAFGTNIPKCKRHENKFCNIEEFIRKNAKEMVDAIRGCSATKSDQILAACDQLMEIANDPTADVSSGECRRCGDVLIMLEAQEQKITHVASTNAAEWELLCGLKDVTFVRVKYPGLD